MRFSGEPHGAITVGEESAERICSRLVADSRVQTALMELYKPLGADQATRREWSRIDPSALEFHRHGTTSMILKGRTRDAVQGHRPPLVLKCLIYPFQRIAGITRSTREYRDEYGTEEADRSPLVRVWASHDNWILMEYIEGRTLASLLSEADASRPEVKKPILQPIDVDRLEVEGRALIGALIELERLGRHHDDLSPSNIILETGDRSVRMRLIDLGVNYLHTRSLSASRSGEARYTAPEVRERGVGDWRADLYSLGMLLIKIGGVDHVQQGIVPDQFYSASPGLARLLEDLVDADPDRRLMVSSLEPERGRYEQFDELFRNEIEVLRQVQPPRPDRSVPRWYRGWKGLLPGAAAVVRQHRAWQVRRRQAAAAGLHGRRAGQFHLRRSRSLMAWALVCAVLSWVTIALVLTWWARDLGIDWAARWLDVFKIVSGRSDADPIPLLDDLRAADYPIPDPVGNLPARIAALTFALPSAKLYLDIFVDMTSASTAPRHGMPRLRSIAVGIAMRGIAVLPWIYMLLPTLVQRSWWSIFVPIGVVTAALTVTACARFCDDAIRRARSAGIATVPHGDAPALHRLGSWEPSAWLYCLPAVLIGLMVYSDSLQDEIVYAAAVGTINIGIWYFKNSISDAPYVRAGMHRAFLAAERLDHLAQRAASEAVPSAREPAEPVADRDADQ